LHSILSPVGLTASSEISLVARRINAGETGWVILTGREGRTDVTMPVSGVPAGVGRPVHLYAGIARELCADPPGPVEHPLTSHVLADASIGEKGPYTLRTSAAVDLASLQSSPHAIVVKSSPADGNRDLFCGDIVAARR